MRSLVVLFRQVKSCTSVVCKKKINAGINKQILAVAADAVVVLSHYPAVFIRYLKE